MGRRAHELADHVRVAEPRREAQRLVGHVPTGRVRADQFGAEKRALHLDARAAESTLFKGLVVSGWHTAAATMRLLVRGELQPAGGIVGAGIDELRWLRPVRTDDVLRIESEVVDVSAPSSGRQLGVL